MSATTLSAAGVIPGPAKDLRVSEALGRSRHRRNTIVRALCFAATAIGLLFLASILATPMRSGTDARGLKNSSFSRMSAFAPAAFGMRRSRTSGVSPTVSVMEL